MSDTETKPGEVVVGDADLAHASETEVRQLETALDDNPQGGEHDDDDHGDERAVQRVDTELDNAPDDEAREAIRARRREERQRRKHNRLEKVDSLERQVQSLETIARTQAEQLARLTNSDNSAKLNQLDEAINEAATVFGQAQAAFSDATAKSDGNRAAEAMEIMLRARDRHTQLTAVKQSAVRSTQQPSPIDPQVRVAAQRFASKHSWYKGPQSTDPDSKIMTLLDNEVAAAGFDPKTDGYWNELESRAKKYLPHRLGSTNGASGDGGGYNLDQPRRTPRSPVGGVSQRGNASGDAEGGFRLSAERVKAMKEAGIWDNPERRAKMIAKYKQLDKDQS